MERKKGAWSLLRFIGRMMIAWETIDDVKIQCKGVLRTSNRISRISGRYEAAWLDVCFRVRTWACLYVISCFWLIVGRVKSTGGTVSVEKQSRVNAVEFLLVRTVLQEKCRYNKSSVFRRRTNNYNTNHSFIMTKKNTIIDPQKRNKNKTKTPSLPRLINTTTHHLIDQTP